MIKRILCFLQGRSQCPQPSPLESFMTEFNAERASPAREKERALGQQIAEQRDGQGVPTERGDIWTGF